LVACGWKCGMNCGGIPPCAVGCHSKTGAGRPPRAAAGPTRPNGDQTMDIECLTAVTPVISFVDRVHGAWHRWKLTGMNIECLTAVTPWSMTFVTEIAGMAMDVEEIEGITEEQGYALCHYVYDANVKWPPIPEELQSFVPIQD